MGARHMANDHITTVLSIVAWGTNLTFGLYDFSVANAFAPACTDVNQLAKEVNLLSQVLRQIGSRLKEDGSLPSQDAFNTVRQVLDQCQDVFREIESLVPLAPSRQGSQDGGEMQMVGAGGAVSPWREENEWSAAMQARARYLLAHLESLKLTMSVMLQTLYTAKSIIWSRYDGTQTAYEAVVVEKSQTEILVVEQQLALLRAYRAYDSFRRQLTDAPLLAQSPQSQALIRRDEYGPNPRALVLYQESTLAQARPSLNEAEDLPKVRMISMPYVDLLLSRWTRINIIEERLKLNQQQQNFRDEPRRASDTYARRNWQAPVVESDSETDSRDRKVPPKLRLTIEDPVLMHINEPRNVSSPIPAGPRSASTLQPPGGPFSPQPSNSWGPSSGGYFAQHKANAPRQRVSPGPSPLSSPRASFSQDFNPGTPPKARPQTAFKSTPADGGPQAHSRSQTQAQAPSPQAKAIPYRLRINQWYWDYLDATLTSSNQFMSPHQAIKTVSKDTMPITEIFQEHVSREAIRERGYDYTRVTRQRIVDGRTREEQCYCIEGALRPGEIQRLVDITERIRSPNLSRAKRDTGGGGNGGPVLAPPQLDRSNTAPVYGNKFRETHASARDYDSPVSSQSSSRRAAKAMSNGKPSASNTSDEDTSGSYKTSSSRSKSRSRKDSGRDHEYDDREKEREVRRSDSKRRGSREKEKERRTSGGGSKTQTLTKIAAGAGLATLLDGLPEMLAYL